MMSSISIGAMFVSILFVFVEGYFAHKDGMLTVSEMRVKYPEHMIGLPFLWHFGMWGDFVIITPLIGWLIASYGSQWSVDEMIILGFLGLMLSGIFHWFYTLTPFPDSLTWKEGVTRAGWFHIIYTATALAIIGLTFFSTESITSFALVTLAIFVFIHATVSGKIFLGFLNTYFLHHDFLPTLLKSREQWVAFFIPPLALFIIVLLTASGG